MAGGTPAKDSSSSTTLVPINVAGSAMRPSSSENTQNAPVRDTTGYYVPPSVIYANMFGQAPGYHISAAPRSNYDPNKALALAEQTRAYQNKAAADLATGYNASLNAMAAQRQAIIDKRAADEAAAKKAAEEAALRKAMNPWGLMTGGGEYGAAQGGLASLQGFIR